MKTIADIRYRLSPSNPFAPIDHCFRLAREYVRRGVRPSRHDGPAVRETWRFLKTRENAADSRHRAQIRRDFPDLTIAFELRFSKSQRLRPVIEALLLAESDATAIAGKLGLTSGTVKAFADAFYDIRHLRAYPIRILRDVIQVVDDCGRVTLDPNKILKLIAFHQKSKGLDRVLGLCATDAAAGGDASSWMLSLLQFSARSRQMFALESLGNTPQGFAALTKLLPDDASTRKADDRTSQTVIERHIEAMLGDLPFACGDDAKQQLAGTVIGELDEGVAELRADELMKVAAGQDIEGLDEIRGFVFPPSRPREGKSEDGSSPLEQISSAKSRR